MIQKQPTCWAEDGHATVVVLYLSCVGAKNTGESLLFSRQADLISIHCAATVLRRKHYSDETMCRIQDATRCDQYSLVTPVLRCNYKSLMCRIQDANHATRYNQHSACNHSLHSVANAFVFVWNSRTLP